MKLIIAVLPAPAAVRAGHHLRQMGVAHTRLASSGGLLEHGYTTLLIGLPAARVEKALALLRQASPGDGVAFVVAAQPLPHGVTTAFPGGPPG